MTRLHSGFAAFAERAQKVIATPEHFLGFWLVVAVWFGWAFTQGFDPFAQLAINAPTTIFEYAFEVLILAAALRAGRGTDAVLAKLEVNEQRLYELMEKVAAMEERELALLEESS